MHRVVYLCCLCIAFPAVAAAEDAETVFQTRVLPVLESHCAKCHGAQKPKAKIRLVGPRKLEQIAGEQNLWFRVLTQVESGAMPPKGQKPLANSDRQAVVGWIRGELTNLLMAKQFQEGRSQLRRLSRSEYANTIQDLFGVRPTVGLNLPEDGRVDGFDKVSAALPLSASGAAGYLKMTDDILNWVLKPIPKPNDPQARPVIRSVAFQSEQSPGHILELDDGWKVSFNSDTTSCPNRGFSTSRPGLHRLRISVYGYQTDKPLAFGVYAGHTFAYPQIIDLVKVLEAPPGTPAVIETEVYLRTGDLSDRSPYRDTLRLIPFGLGVQVPKNSQAADCKGPGLAFHWIDVQEPELPLPGDRWLTADFPPALNDELRSHWKVIANATGPKNLQAKSTDRKQFLTVMRTTFQRVGARLFRRDLTAPELAKIVDDIAQRLDSGVTLDRAFLDEVTELMTSPEFLCVIEEPGRLTDFALASRLSYFLWNSTPDEPLSDLARSGRLHEPQILREQTERLLNDPQSARFVSDFINQWLGLRAIDDTSPDGVLYPEYALNDLLKPSSVWETQAFFRHMLDENLSVRHFVASPWAIVNGPLAKHYGLRPVTGIEMQKVTLPKSSPYGGLWTQSSLMKVTANGTNTSPVKRGVWVAERLLGIPIPPPPPNVNPIEPDVRGAKTLREQLALHRGSGSCAGCHAKFDPYGFALESFDVTGGFRTKYRKGDPDVIALPQDKRKGRSTWRNGLPVDCSGQTPDGRRFAGIAELRKMLAEKPEQLARGITRHFVTYATGAPATVLDQPAIDRIVSNSAREDYGLRSLVHALVQSELFQSK